MRFYLGTPEPSWLRRAVRLPLFVSRNRLVRLARLPRARTPWALDSGGFHQITAHGRWFIDAATYCADVARYDQEIGGMEWAAPMDWMAEAKALWRSGLSAVEHQARTVENYLELRELWPQFSDDTCPIMPVVQGDPTVAPDAPGGHLACVTRYAAAGVDLAAANLVGLGSVCRLESTERIVDTVSAVVAAVPGIALHGFGVASRGLARVGHLLASADSQSWSYGGRYDADLVRTDACTHAGTCNWCSRHALRWRNAVLDIAGQPRDLARFPEHDAA
jgi:hypothetical protein